MQNQEWLIINVTTTKIAGSKFYQRKGSVLDKIRADFNTGKRDRSVFATTPGSIIRSDGATIDAYKSHNLLQPRIRPLGPNSRLE